MKMVLVLLIPMLTVLISCDLTIIKEENKNLTSSLTEETDQGNLKMIKLNNDFIVRVGNEEDYEKFKTYTYFQLTRNNSIIYVDSSLTEYEFGNKLFPMVLKTGENSFELLFEINNRPGRNYLKRLFIKNNQLVTQDKVPAFEAKSIDLNRDGIKEYAGYWDYPEEWGKNYELMTYSPILYYALTEKGLRLDSALTKERNELIYGKFYGYEYSEEFALSKTVLDKFEQELKVINSKQ